MYHASTTTNKASSSGKSSSMVGIQVLIQYVRKRMIVTGNDDTLDEKGSHAVDPIALTCE